MRGKGALYLLNVLLIGLGVCLCYWYFLFKALVGACVMIWCIAMGWVLVGRISILYAWHQHLACLLLAVFSYLTFHPWMACLARPRHGMVALFSGLGKVLIIWDCDPNETPNRFQCRRNRSHFLQDRGVYIKHFYSQDAYQFLLHWKQELV